MPIFAAMDFICLNFYLLWPIKEMKYLLIAILISLSANHSFAEERVGINLERLKTGNLPTLSGMQTLSFCSVSKSQGAHMEVLVKLKWKSKGKEKSQILIKEMVDSHPKISVVNGKVRVEVDYHPWGAEPFSKIYEFQWLADQNKFVKL